MRNHAQDPRFFSDPMEAEINDRRRELDEEIEQESATCSYCNRPATRFHVAPAINGKAMPAVPLCGSACRVGTLAKKKGRSK